MQSRLNIFELQPLEVRRFLAVNVTTSGNTLIIVGDNSSEFITVNRNASNKLTVTGWGPTFTIGSADGQINQISLAGQGGSDTILLTNNVRFPSNNAGIPGTISGGNGNDTITGGPGNETLSDKIASTTYHNRNCAGCLLGSDGCCRALGYDDIHTQTDELGCEDSVALVFTLGKAVLKQDVLPLDIT
jgi:hypothetical protein